MMNKHKTPLKLFKSKAIQTKTPLTIDVGIDVFGNAIPETKSAQVGGTGKALRIVKRQAITLTSSPS